MYELKIKPYEIDGFQINDDFHYINSKFIPRVNEMIEKLRISVEDDDEKMNDYLLNVKVEEVHYELFKDNSTMPVVYGNVIEIEKVENDNNGRSSS